VTSYLTNSNFGTIENKKRVFRLLQFLSFSRRYFTYKKDLFSQKYYVIKFPVRDFLDFIKIENKNHYQYKKVIDFLQDLQKNIPPVTVFSENYFRSVAGIPFVEIQFVEIQKEHKSLVAKVPIKTISHFNSRNSFYWYFLITFYFFHLLFKLNFW